MSHCDRERLFSGCWCVLIYPGTTKLGHSPVHDQRDGKDELVCNQCFMRFTRRDLDDDAFERITDVGCALRRDK